MTAKPMLILIAGPFRSGTTRRRGLPACHDVAEIPRRTAQVTA